MGPALQTPARIQPAQASSMDLAQITWSHKLRPPDGPPASALTVVCAHGTSHDSAIGSPSGSSAARSTIESDDHQVTGISAM